MSDKNHSPPLVSLEETLNWLSRSGVEITHTTLVNWCKDRGWGYQLPGGRWMVLRTKLEEFHNATRHAVTEAASKSDPS